MREAVCEYWSGDMVSFDELIIQKHFESDPKLVMNEWETI